MTPQLQHPLESHQLWFGSYKKSGELVKIQVWLTINNGHIEFLTGYDSYKVKRIRRNPRVVCNIGHKDGPSISGTAEIVMGSEAMLRVYRAYWKTHRFVMTFLTVGIRFRIKTRKDVVIRVHPDEPNPRQNGIEDCRSRK
jgi:PPOX class probable F420-dependent enzyme